MGLGALHITGAPKAAGADTDHALDDVKTLAQRVARRVQQGADALLLVVVQDRPAHAVGAERRLKTDQQHHAHQSQHHRRGNPFPTHAGEKNHRQTGQ